jgi:hypothetical protein
MEKIQQLCHFFYHLELYNELNEHEGEHLNWKCEHAQPVDYSLIDTTLDWKDMVEDLMAALQAVQHPQCDLICSRLFFFRMMSNWESEFELKSIFKCLKDDPNALVTFTPLAASI